MKLIISIDDMNDIVVLKNEIFFKEIFKQAETIIDKKGEVIIQQEYTNTTPDFLKKFRNKKDLKNWEKHLDELIQKKGD